MLKEPHRRFSLTCSLFLTNRNSEEIWLESVPPASMDMSVTILRGNLIYSDAEVIVYQWWPPGVNLPLHIQNRSAAFLLPILLRALKALLRRHGRPVSPATMLPMNSPKSSHRVALPRSLDTFVHPPVPQLASIPPNCFTSLELGAAAVRLSVLPYTTSIRLLLLRARE